MGKDSAISWTHHTHNLTWGCQKVSEGCQHCYAHDLANAKGQTGLWGPAKTSTRRKLSADYWRQPVLWNRDCAKRNVRERVFCGSMCDWAEDHPIVNEEREKLWPLIQDTPYLDWLLLTKRPENIEGNHLLPKDWGQGGYPNTWLGVSIESNAYLWRLETLWGIPAVVRFVSYEPALGPLDRATVADVAKADWWIYGGESGPHARKDEDEWAEELRGKTIRAGSRFFYKQTSGPVQGMRPTLYSRTYQDFPTPRTVPLPSSFQAEQPSLF
jgi:protein gp37